MKLMMVAGELSGDVHGAAILSSLQPLIPDLNAFGIGGAKMMAAGFTSHVPISDMQARGFVEVLRNLPKHLRILRQAVELLERERPTVLLLIDYPGFNLKLAEAARRRGVPVIYFSGPQLWAWHGSRMRTVARTVSKMIVLFPFELTLYREAGVDAVFLGHPLVGEGAAPSEVDALKARLELHPGRPVVAVMPGSRPGELRRHLPRLLAAIRLMEAEGFLADFVLPVAETLDGEEVRRMVRESGTSVQVAENAFLPLLKFAELGMVASGTANLQAGLAGFPFLVVYHFSPTTFWFLKNFAYVKFLSIVNLLAGREIVPELLQNDFSPEKVKETFLAIARDSSHQARIRKDLAAMAASLGEPGAYQRAAEIIATHLRQFEGTPPAARASSG